MAKFQYDTTANQADIILNGSSLLTGLLAKQIQIIAASPLVLDSSGNLSIDLSNYAKLITNGSYKQIPFDSTIRISSDSINTFYIDVFNGSIWKNMAKFQYNMTTNKADLLLNGTNSLLNSLATK